MFVQDWQAIAYLDWADKRIEQLKKHNDHASDSETYQAKAIRELAWTVIALRKQIQTQETTIKGFQGQDRAIFKLMAKFRQKFETCNSEYGKLILEIKKYKEQLEEIKKENMELEAILQEAAL